MDSNTKDKICRAVFQDKDPQAKIKQMDRNLLLMSVLSIFRPEAEPESKAIQGEV